MSWNLFGDYFHSLFHYLILGSRSLCGTIAFGVADCCLDFQGDISWERVFPIKIIYHSVSDWCERKLGHSLRDIAIWSLLTVAGVAIINGIGNLFSWKRE